MPNASTTEGSNGEMQQPSELHEMEAKMAALQAENERLTQLYEAECQLRHIEVTAYNQVFEMYAVPKAEAEEFARRLQVETVSNEESYQSGAMAGAIPMETPDVTGNTTSVETLLKETFPHIKIHSLDDPPEHQIAGDEEALVGDDADAKTDEEELEQHLFQLQSMVGSAIDERAKQTLLSLPPEHGKAALGKVEDIIHEQGGVCRNLSSMVQSVCRKVFGDGGVLKELGKQEVELEAESQQMSLETLRAQNRLIEEYVMRLVRQRDELKQVTKLAEERDSYFILGLHGPSVSEDEVKKAYRNLARKEHPDKAGIGNKKRFQAIQQAYTSILKQRQLGGPAVAEDVTEEVPKEVESSILRESYKYGSEAQQAAEWVALGAHRVMRVWEDSEGKRRSLRSLRELTRHRSVPRIYEALGSSCDCWAVPQTLQCAVRRHS
ncbi:unnamed protein product [Durusdinium trenchii]|uniref:J domain-containing protein n=1 Tax=Durusdinium trenchii TaxID=1381693 RepID=A0ABP0NNA0_9DINO